MDEVGGRWCSERRGLQNYSGIGVGQYNCNNTPALVRHPYHAISCPPPMIGFDVCYDVVGHGLFFCFMKVSENYDTLSSNPF